MTLSRMARSTPGRVAIVLLVVALGAVLWQYQRIKQVRQELFRALTPVALSNCTLERIGDANDGGYLFCGNLLAGTAAAYSYGINGTDEWGCQLSQRLGIPVHQYDCFNLTAPACGGGDARFNAECVGPDPATIDGRAFDTMVRQVAKNGDTGKRLVVKMDVEGSEWKSLLEAPDGLLNDIDQLAVEFHEIEDPRFIETVRRLQRLFHIVHVHQNNFGCEPGLDPFTSSYFEVLFVNKRVGQLDPSARAGGPHALDAPNAPWLPDCQELTPANASSEIALFRRWLRRVGRALMR